MEKIILTKRQREVFRLWIVDLKSAKEIAETLNLAVNTVRWHITNIYERIQVQNRVQAFRRATRLGIEF